MTCDHERMAAAAIATWYLTKVAGWSLQRTSAGSVLWYPPRGHHPFAFATDLMGAFQAQIVHERKEAIASGRADPNRIHPLQSS